MGTGHDLPGTTTEGGRIGAVTDEVAVLLRFIRTGCDVSRLNFGNDMLHACLPKVEVIS